MGSSWRFPVATIILKRSKSGNDFTHGTLSFGAFSCFTLEDVVRPDGVKIEGMTAIPPGTYEVVFTMSNRFKKVLPLLLSVPAFSGVRIHSGNKSTDTEGCILVGQASDNKGTISKSKPAYCNLFAIIKKTLAAEKVFIEIRPASGG
jgi:hypothetical protein